ncbi:MAG: PLP-dependent aminotransferase family protein [Clostridiales bacterium]|nr:PLP-dependent aminotransferase family protein [Clostridiales bacterium]
MDYQFSDKMKSLQPSAIREILKNTSSPDVIPLAAGNPAEEAFPVEAVRRISQEILEEQGAAALQYGITEGYEPLRRRLSDYLQGKERLFGEDDQLLITSGAQQVMDLAAKVLCNEGDCIVCESPSFVGALNSFRSYHVRLRGVPVEADGMCMEALEQALREEERVRFIYTIPNFQNPSGATMSLEKRRRLYELARRYNVLIVEDNPYGDLRVSGKPVASVKSMDADARVIYAGSFSKILSPGLRVGYAVVPAPVASKMVVGKQASDVHTPVFNQMIVERWMERYDMEAHIRNLQAIYRRKLAVLCDALDDKLAGFLHYHRPEGGLFVWGELPEGVDMPDFCRRAAQAGVAVVPGTAFLPDASAPCSHVRMNFSTPSDEAMVRAADILGGLVKTQYRQD